MSKLIEVAVIIAIAAVMIAAKQSSKVDMVAPPASISPMEMMINVGPLPETEVSF